MRVIVSKTNPLSLSCRRWPNFNIHHEPDCRRRCYADSREFSLCAFSAHTSEQKAAVKKAFYCWVMMPSTARRWETGQENSSSCRNSFNITILNNIRVHSPVQKGIAPQVAQKRGEGERDIGNNVLLLFIVCM